MISDTLSDAIAEIRRYLADMPEVYDGHETMIQALLTDMDAVRAVLDAPPPRDMREAAREEAFEAARMSVSDALDEAVNAKMPSRY